MATKVALNVRAAMMHDENAAGGVHYLARPEDGHACACAEAGRPLQLQPVGRRRVIGEASVGTAAIDSGVERREGLRGGGVAKRARGGRRRWRRMVKDVVLLRQVSLRFWRRRRRRCGRREP